MQIQFTVKRRAITLVIQKPGSWQRWRPRRFLYHSSAQWWLGPFGLLMDRNTY